VVVHIGATIEGVWATPAARGEFSASERQECLADYGERGPQWVAAKGGVGFRYYIFPDGRCLVLVDNRGKVSVMTLEEMEEAREAK
jgi:hypothetical protein